MDAETTLADILGSSKRLLIFTGAGISVDSGIPDFRSENGVWAKIDPFSLSTAALAGGRKGVAMFWRTMTTLADSLIDPEPNASHFAVKRLQDQGKVELIVTQNVDGLHQAAGSSIDSVVELHGNTTESYCKRCNQSWPTTEIVARVHGGDASPRCECGGVIRPKLTVFGDPLPDGVLHRAMDAARNCDVCLVLGSSLTVTPAADVPLEAKRAGAKLVIVSIGDTPLDRLADVRFREPLGECFAPIVA
ncbi:MAG: NAD-dependent deacetylase [Bradymonadia bacterium]